MADRNDSSTHRQALGHTNGSHGDQRQQYAVYPSKLFHQYQLLPERYHCTNFLETPHWVILPDLV